MTNKLIILIMFILFASFVTAIDQGNIEQGLRDKLVETWSFENISLGNKGEWNMSTSGINYDGGGKFGSSMICADANSDEIWFSMTTPLSNFTFCGWYNYSVNMGDNKVVIATTSTTSGSHYYMYYTQPNTANGDNTYADTGTEGRTQQTNPFNKNGFTFICQGAQIDSDNDLVMSYNNQTYQTDTGSMNTVAVWNPQYFNIFGSPHIYDEAGGAYNAGTGCMDEVMLFNDVLSEQELSYIRNLTTKFPLVGATDFTISAARTYFGDTLTTFNATVNGTLYTTTNGTIVTNYDNGDITINITLIADQHDIKTYYNTNLAINLAATLDYNKYLLNVSAVDQFSNILPFNVSLNGTLYETLNRSVLLETPRNSSYSLEIAKTGFNTITDTIIINNFVKEYNYTFFWDHYKLNVTATDFYGNAIQTFSVSANGSNTVNGSTTTYNAILQLNQNETYTINIDAPNYAFGISDITINTWLYNYTFVLYTTNSINFTFYEEGTNLLINFQDVFLELISTPFSNNYTTANATLFLDLLSPSDYTLRYSSAGFNENFYYFSLVNRTHYNLDLYLTNSTIATETTATVFDYSNKVVEDVEIRALRYNVATNTYILVSECKTNFLGECVLNLVQNTEYYKFLLYYGGELKKTTSPTYIYDTTISFQITLDDPVGTPFYNSQEIIADLIFNNITNNFKFTFSDNNGVATQFCLDVEKKSALLTESFNSSCLTTAAGTILINIPIINGTTFVANSYATISGQEYFLGSLTKEWGTPAPESKLFLFGIVLLTILAAFMFVYSITIGVLIVPLPLLVGAWIGLVNVNLSVAIGIEILAIIIAIILNKEG